MRVCVCVSFSEIEVRLGWVKRCGEGEGEGLGWWGDGNGGFVGCWDWDWDCQWIIGGRGGEGRGIVRGGVDYLRIGWGMVEGMCEMHGGRF